MILRTFEDVEIDPVKAYLGASLDPPVWRVWVALATKSFLLKKKSPGPVQDTDGERRKVKNKAIPDIRQSTPVEIETEAEGAD